MPKYQVMMLAFATEVGQQPVIREVELPDTINGKYLTEDADTNDLLEMIFYYGQNDFQPQKLPSVSVGDVAILDGRFYRVAGVGWEELTAGELEEYCKLNRRDRYFYKAVSPVVL